MNTAPTSAGAELLDRIDTHLENDDFAAVSAALESAGTAEIVGVLERMSAKRSAMVFRLLPKGRALAVFERVPAKMQGDLIRGLRDAEIASIIEDLDPDDRVRLLDELPSALAPRLLHGLSEAERELTAGVLGYPKDSIGRQMSPEYVSVRAVSTAAEAMHRVLAAVDEAETVYTLPVLDGERHVIGVVSLRDLLRAKSESTVAEIMTTPHVASAYDDAEVAARACTDLRVLALPIVDAESRLVGILTVDDAVRILEDEETEDAARQGGVEPLGRPYFATPVRTLVTSRIVWLLVLAIGATMTVQVLSIFETTLEEVSVLALFVPLLIGTGGNTGNQAATTVTRALALGDVRPRDLMKVLVRELTVGASLGALLGLIGGVVTGVIYRPEIGVVIGMTLLAVCTMAATIGGIMPMIARALHVDPAVFSNPFITTFVDASGLIVYFLVAKTVLQI